MRAQQTRSIEIPHRLSQKEQFAWLSAYGLYGGVKYPLEHSPNARRLCFLSYITARFLLTDFFNVFTPIIHCGAIVQ